MIGHYKIGSGQAHLCCHLHDAVFNCKMYGTFNIQIPHLKILSHVPVIVNGPKRYWFVKIVDKVTGQEYRGWAIRDKGSKQRVNTLEILTKRLLPESLKCNELEVDILMPWPSSQVTRWAANKYWFQGFTFAPVQRADSEFTWNAIDVINWSGLDVLDIGCHYGYISFKASKQGSNVLGVDNNVRSLHMARTIRDYAIQQDVTFVEKFEPRSKAWDVVMYLSVHHQCDKNYQQLASKIEDLKMMTRKHVFIELILPPMFPKDGHLTEKEIDSIVGGTTLRRYTHKVRGIRKIYHIVVPQEGKT